MSDVVIELQTQSFIIEVSQATATKTVEIEFAGYKGTPGNDGREIELRSTLTHIQWRYVGDADWINLVDISDLAGSPGPGGTNGREIELRNNGTFIQWRYVGDVSWTNLIALSAITGPPGSTGMVDYDLAIIYAMVFG